MVYALDQVPGLEVVEAVDPDAAFHAGADLVDLVLEPPQRLDDAVVDDFLAADDPHLALDYAAAE